MNTPLRVLHLIPTLNAGGAERVVLELCARMKDQGVDVSVISLFGSGPLHMEFESRGVDIEVIPGHSWLRAFRIVWQRIHKEHPNVIHSHLFGADVIGRLAGFWGGVPVRISTEHNVNIDYGIMKRLVNIFLSVMTTKYISVSAEAKRFLCSREWLALSRVVVIENGIDISRVKVRGPQPFHDLPRLIAVGRLTSQKGFDVLLKALAGLRRPWMLDLIGTGPDERSLKRLAEDLRIAGRIRFLGFASDVPERLADADVFCMPSRYEGLGLAFVEAASAGLPIVASNLKVFQEIVGPKDVEFVPVNDVLALRHAIDRMLSHPAPFVAQAAKNALNVRNTFNADRMVERYIQLYRTLLSA